MPLKSARLMSLNSPLWTAVPLKAGAGWVTAGAHLEAPDTAKSNSIYLSFIYQYKICNSLLFLSICLCTELTIRCMLDKTVIYCNVIWSMFGLTQTYKHLHCLSGNGWVGLRVGKQGFCRVKHTNIKHDFSWFYRYISPLFAAMYFKYTEQEH